MARKDPQFNFRLPQALLDRVRGEADGNRRSATAEMITLVEEGLKWRESKKEAQCA